MQCPGCQSELHRRQYEGLPVFACDRCKGYLVATRRIEHINRRREKSAEVLRQEASVEQSTQGERNVRCPRCYRPMVEEYRKHPVPLHIDTCSDCDLVWFDPGELARMQIGYEATAQAKETAELQHRARNMTPEERTQFERNLANLPEGTATLASAFGQGLIESIGNLGYWLRLQMR